jgi:hypothetical protein
MRCLSQRIRNVTHFYRVFRRRLRSSFTFFRALATQFRRIFYSCGSFSYVCGPLWSHVSVTFLSYVCPKHMSTCAFRRQNYVISNVCVSYIADELLFRTLTTCFAPVGLQKICAPASWSAFVLFFYTRTPFVTRSCLF